MDIFSKLKDDHQRVKEILSQLHETTDRATKRDRGPVPGDPRQRMRSPSRDQRMFVNQGARRSLSRSKL